jgi:hypothetical protein
MMHGRGGQRFRSLLQLPEQPEPAGSTSNCGMRTYYLLLGSALTLAMLLPRAQANASSFDLAGPPLEVKVIRGNKSLPISEVPNLVEGDWQPLATLVRLPSLKEIRCPDKIDQPCLLSGANLFLIDSVASDPQFAKNMPVPAGFADSSLSVPRPNGTVLYMKLRDDPSAVNIAALPVLPQP